MRASASRKEQKARGLIQIINLMSEIIQMYKYLFRRIAQDNFFTCHIESKGQRVSFFAGDSIKTYNYYLMCFGFKSYDPTNELIQKFTSARNAFDYHSM